MNATARRCAGPSSTPPATCSSARATPHVSIRKIAERIEYSPAAIYSYFAGKDDIFFALAEEGFRLLSAPPSDRTGLDRLDPLERVRAAFWRMYEFSREHPEYFSLMFVDRSVPRISREYERFAFAREVKGRVVAYLQEAVDAGALPPTVRPMVAFRLLTMGLLGVAVMRLSDRLAPSEDADALARDVLDVTIAGLRSGIALRSPALDCPLDRMRRSGGVRSAGRGAGDEESSMNRRFAAHPAGRLARGRRGLTGACSAADAQKGHDAAAAAAIAVAPVAAVEHPVARFIRVTGTLKAEEQADVAAETAGPRRSPRRSSAARRSPAAPSSSASRRSKPTRS